MAQSPIFSSDKLRFIFSRIKERLWVKPLLLCLLSIGGTFSARLADNLGLSSLLPEITLESVESLLTIMASSMLVIATFAVGSMIAAYASASAGATPRSLPLVIADDVTQNALSAFIGAFIFSIVSLVAIKNDLFGSAGRFAIFILTLMVFAIVIITFVRWVDRIARLGRVVNTIEKAEMATSAALDRRRHAPTLGALEVLPHLTINKSGPVFSPTVGYVQHIDMKTLQSCAETLDCHVIVTALPGKFVSTSCALLHVVDCIEECESSEKDAFASAFTISPNRTFEDDPRFGILALSEIADKALSPGINDPGTAINVIGTMVRLFTLWQSPLEQDQIREITYDRVSVPKLSIDDLFDDAFTAIARDGAGIVEVSTRLQKALSTLAETEDKAMGAAAKRHSRMALARSEHAMSLQDDIDAVRLAAGGWSARS
ncbi:DUF2254 domain-containing protein [Halomonas urumqiensis]|uniref:DUF2254 domain-containing protein n=1 Tax=Halomonas urumqiensis TaxID=1684789 RepID=A0A2N7UP20_9GAMM|nr:DUF2254 domain-containing protein [Halomonas urumqiensis]PMR82166.1 DUF2254 domain-containing protein [Halomonas urumqiensis]PTB03058.1 DUF2254 domain-containing protein [Halomonas urumqiensis]GHE20812.1 hypothetical protein GCM10017767_13330 [Halomonas urumqiensis]